MKNLPTVRCGFGLGNRVAAIAAGLSRHREILFVWRDNEHCPTAWDEVFPEGVPGVHFDPTPPPDFATCYGGIPSHDWACGIDPETYLRVFRQVAGHDDSSPPAEALIARFLASRQPQAIPPIAPLVSARAIHVLADSRHEEIAAVMARLGIVIHWAAVSPLAADLRRTGTVAAFAAAWKLAASAPRAVTLSGPFSSLLYPFLASSRPISQPT